MGESGRQPEPGLVRKPVDCGRAQFFCPFFSHFLPLPPDNYFYRQRSPIPSGSGGDPPTRRVRWHKPAIRRAEVFTNAARTARERIRRTLSDAALHAAAALALVVGPAR